MKIAPLLVVTMIFLAIVPGCLEDNEEYTTEFMVNGMKVIYRKTSGETTSAALFLKGGVRNLNKSNQGTEYFLFNLAIRGSEKYNKDELSAELSKMGSRLGVDVDKDYMTIYLACPSKYFSETWDIFVDALLNPKLDENECEIVREQLISQAKFKRDHPDSRIWKVAGEQFFGSHPYSLEPRGTVECINRIKLRDLKEYHSQNMATSKLLLVIVTTEPERKVRRMVENAFGDLPEGNYKDGSLPEIPNILGLNVEQRKTATNYVVGYWKGPDSGSEKYYKTQVTAQVLNYYLAYLLREEIPLAYEVSAALQNKAEGYGYLYITTIEPELAVQLMFVSVSQLALISFYYPDAMQDFIDSVVYTMETSYYSSKESVLYQAFNLGWFELLGGGWGNEENYINYLKSVDAKDVGSSLSRWVKNVSFGMLGPARVDEEYFLGLNPELAQKKISQVISKKEYAQ
jgi:predicted Zn-dependent peptidase